MVDQSRIKLFLVEDDRIDQMAFEKFVEKENLPYEYIVAGSIKSAKTYLTKHKFDIILSDFQLNDGNAFELFDKVNETPIIMVTGTGDEEIAVTAMKAGAYDYLIKDMNGNYLKTLPVTVENALNRKRYERELNEYRERLEELVDARTNELKSEIIRRKHAEQLLKTLNTAALAMENAMSHKDIFSAVSKELKKINYACTIMLIDEEQQSLIPKYKNFDAEIISEIQNHFNIDLQNLHISYQSIPIFLEVVKNRKTVFTENLSSLLTHFISNTLPEFNEAHIKSRHTDNAIFAPLIVNDKITGILSIHSSELSIEDIPTITAFSNQIAATWHKSNLMQDLANSLDQLRRTQDQLLRAQKLEAIGRLAGGIAHDFNNLLTAILGNAELIQTDIESNSPISDEVNEITKAARRAASLTNQLLAFSRRQTLQPKVLDLNDIVSNIEKMLRRLIGENITLQTNLDDMLGNIKADPGQMEQLIMNLAINSSDAMPEGGVISIITENTTITDDYCRDQAFARPGEFVQLTVSDTGTGIPPHVLENIFEPFFSTKGPRQGTGLGLSVVYGIVKQHEGWITVHSEVNKGTVFQIYFPVESELPKDEPDYYVEMTSLKGNGERILLIEDEISVSRVATKALLENGYVVFSTFSTSEAMEVFQKENGNFDLIFSDVVLPDKTGIEFMEEILKTHPQMHVLLSSGYTDQKSQWPIIKAKGFRFVQKPYALIDLLKAIRELIVTDVHVEA
ncbi:response regulator [candidate division KSB1 bacterium]|nr:response regulator [candidate division KSB1 bacterium]